MERLTGLKPTAILALYIIVDIICIGMGMGVPFFCILLGLPTGWVLAQYITRRSSDFRRILRQVLSYSALTAGVTMLGMIAVWLPTISWLVDPAKDVANFGIPMILYEPKASYIGWMALMVVISPVLQMLVTLFSSHLAILAWLKKIPGN